MAEKKHILAKLAPILILGGIAVLAYSLYVEIITVALLVKSAIAGIVGALAMSVAMEMVKRTGKMQVMIPKLVAGNLGIENLWMLVHFGTGISFGIAYAIIAGFLGFSLSIIGAIVFSLLGPEMFLGIVILPDNGMGFFGSKGGAMMPMMTVVMHIIFGFFMGLALLIIA